MSETTDSFLERLQKGGQQVVLEEEDDIVEVEDGGNENAAKSVPRRSPKSASSTPGARVSMVELRSGDVLTSGEASRLMATAQTRVVVLAGDSESGKTTLLAAIFELFQRGPFAEYQFCGSQTLMAFEERCWLARIASDSAKPDTGKSSAGVRSYLHLPVSRDPLGGDRQELLIVDISGEDFREARKSPEICRELHELGRADHLVLVIDGSKLSQPNTRHVAVRNVSELLDRFLDLDMLPSKPNVHIFISKYDELHKLAADDNAHEFVKSLDKQLHERFDEKVGCLNVFQVAARPFKSDLELGHGLAEPFRAWVEVPFFPMSAAAPGGLAEHPTREFDKFPAHIVMPPIILTI